MGLLNDVPQKLLYTDKKKNTFSSNVKTWKGSKCKVIYEEMNENLLICEEAVPHILMTPYIHFSFSSVYVQMIQYIGQERGIP